MRYTLALVLGLATLSFVFVPTTARAGHACVYNVEWAPCWGGYAYSHAPAYVPPVNYGYTAHPSVSYPYEWMPYSRYPRYSPYYGYGYPSAYPSFTPNAFYGGYYRGGWVSLYGPRGGAISVGW